MILDLFKLDGKVAVVTGANTGLGQGMAVALAEAGAKVVRMALTRRWAKNICMEPLSNFVSHSLLNIADFNFFVNRFGT